MQVKLNLPDELLQHITLEHLAREIVEALVVQAYQLEKSPVLRLGVF